MILGEYLPALMATFPGVPWRDWEAGVSYELLMRCVRYIDQAAEGGGGDD